MKILFKDQFCFNAAQYGVFLMPTWPQQTYIKNSSPRTGISAGKDESKQAEGE